MIRIFIYLLAFVVICDNGFSQEVCGLDLTGCYSYTGEFGTVYTEIKDSKYYEYHNHGKQYILTRISSIDGCKFELTLLKAKMKLFPFKKGEVLKREITRVEGDIIFFMNSYGGNTWETSLVRIDAIPESVKRRRF